MISVYIQVFFLDGAIIQSIKAPKNNEWAFGGRKRNSRLSSYVRIVIWRSRRKTHTCYSYLCWVVDERTEKKEREATFLGRLRTSERPSKRFRVSTFQESDRSSEEE